MCSSRVHCFHTQLLIGPPNQNCYGQTFHFATIFEPMSFLEVRFWLIYEHKTVTSSMSSPKKAPCHRASNLTVRPSYAALTIMWMWWKASVWAKLSGTNPWTLLYFLSLGPELSRFWVLQDLRKSPASIAVQPNQSCPFFYSFNFDFVFDSHSLCGLNGQ